MVAGLTVLLALVVRLLLESVLANGSPFLLFTPAVAIAAIYGGAVPGIVATALSTAAGSHFFLSATNETLIERWDRVVLFVIVGSVITGSSSLLRRSRQELAASLWREQKARAMAEAADRTKDDFLAMVSHELQTPLSVVLGWIEVIRQQRLSADALDRAIETIERNARMLSRLVDDVLDRSRIATGRLRLDRQVISLATALLAAVDQMRDKIEAAGIRFDCALTADECLVLGDSIRLQQVFSNLLTNALKFTPSGGRIDVFLTVTEGAAQISVADTGSGISPDILPHVFEPFRQSRSTLRQTPHGLGLGLAIARYIIEQHHGTLTAASAGEGRGSIFTVILPLVASRHARTAASKPGSIAHQGFTHVTH